MSWIQRYRLRNYIRSSLWTAPLLSMVLALIIHQFVYTTTADGSQGIGIFGRIGFGDRNTNILEAATNWLYVTPDMQVIEPVGKRATTAFLTGLRVQMRF